MENNSEETFPEITKNDGSTKPETTKNDEDSDSSLNESLFSCESLYKQTFDQQAQNAAMKMNEADQQRYETFRSSNFPKSAIKKLIGTIIGQAVNPNIVIGVAGISKVFIGEMVEEAKKIQKEMNDDGPLLPSHIHEAHRRLFNKLPNMKLRPKAPWG
jgi:transcription initiation factor TFIID subunit 11